MKLKKGGQNALPFFILFLTPPKNVWPFLMRYYPCTIAHTMIKSITVFCGSSAGNEVVYKDAATLLGQTLAKQNITLVYGGARIGIMGAVADAVMNSGGKAIGVIPYFLKTVEVAHDGLTELIVVDSMHERKTKMNDLCDGVIALPGGFGTMEEFFEMLTWAQLGLHKKPIALFNVAGFYDSLIALIQTMVEKGFLSEVNQKMLFVANDVYNIIEQMKNYKAPEVKMWINKDMI